MLEPPIATSSPVPRTKQWGRRKSKNNRRSISLLDVSVIPTPDVSSQKCESNETLTSVCKDSGYVQSEGSWLEDEESRESKDLVEELKFKNVLISELQESNRGLRMRCADAENKIWSLRIKCEEHCKCCQVQGADQLDGHDELLRNSNDQFDYHLSHSTPFKRHSLAVSKFNAGDDGYGAFRGPALSSSSFHPSAGSTKNKPLVRSLSSSMIPMRKSHTQIYKGGADDLQLTPESLSLSKVQWWQRDLSTRGHQLTAQSSQISQTIQQKCNQSHKKILGESHNLSQPDELCDLVSDDARLISRLVLRNSEEEYTENNERQADRNEKLDRYYPCSSDENGNRTNNLTDVCAAQNSNMVLTRVHSLHSSSSESVSSSSPLFTSVPTRKSVLNTVQTHQNQVSPVLLTDTMGGLQHDCQPLSHNNNLEMSKYAEDAIIPKPSCELDCCLHSHKTGINSNTRFPSSINTLSENHVLESQPHCNCRHPPSQIIIVPTVCCCRLVDSNTLCRQSCCPYEGNVKCDHQCHISSEHHRSSCLDVPEAQLPLFVPKIKSASTQCQDSPSLPVNFCDLDVIPELIPSQRATPRNDSNDCDSISPCSGRLTVPLAHRMDSKEKLKREIEERMNKLASVARAETDSLSFKPWPPPHFAEMNPLMRCLIETSEYARQMAMVSDKAISRVQRLENQLNPSV